MSINYVRTIVNSATDPGVLFNVGNTSISMTVSPTAAGINLATAAFCFATRALNEIKKDGVEISFTPAFNNVINNPGTSLQVAGAGTGIAGAYAAMSGDLTSAQTIIPVAMLFSFSAGNIIRGAAINLPENSQTKNILEAIGLCAISSGMTLAYGPEAPLLVKSAFAAAAGAGIAAIALKKSSISYFSDTLYSLASVYSAVTTGQATHKFANAFAAGGFASIIGLKIAGGTYETYQATRDSFKNYLFSNNLK